MRVEPDTDGKEQVNVHYVNSPVPCVVEENFGGYYGDHDDFVLEEDLQDQETIYLSLQRSSQRNTQINVPRASSTTNLRANQDSGSSREERNSSETMNVEVQLAVDEALARELQEKEDQFAGTSVGETAGMEIEGSGTESSAGNGEGISTETPAQVAREDVDPDNMTYEELQTLTEAIGTESRGLSEELISYLPSSTYKTGPFSKRDEYEECVICYMAYEKHDKLITLPCQHLYHKHCIARWLKINKACPVCNDDVFG
ncbi:uncharacterized protein A4U43_C10F10900 [Asparagus officinalis]|uniref:RING-type domain-containing protein n=1 Tax=Asparagus officinalis TaxID=4686 RepID=A0A5P1E2F5_ASPOF|nr:E3 ubiquitin ligase BIG BROTHER-like [Asparagus officinalis]ONK56629.1 uncharacterized protein A4U43_C10F10900 [Asparagus officinalis]